MSSPTVSAREFLQRAQAQLHRIERSRGELQAARSDHEQKSSELARARATALDELTVACLPELTRVALERVRTETGYGRFAVDDPFAYIEQRREFLTARIAEIDADERFVRRAALLDPVTGELMLELAALEKDLDLLHTPLQRYESESRLLDLLKCGYDTDSYSQSIWTLKYYSDWKWGDIFCERFSHERFSQVREAYLNLRNAYVAQLRDVEALRREIAAVEALATEREEATRKLDTIQEDTLTSCRKLVHEHLEHIDRADLAEWMKADPTKVALVKRLHGIERKMDYLGELAARQFGSEEETLARASDKLRRKMTKYQRSKHFNDRIPVREADAWLQDPTPRLAERRSRFRRDYDRVDDFDRYDAFDYASDMLWWDLMTDGRIDGDFIPEVSSWHAAHPDRQPLAGPDLARAGNAYAPTEERDELHEVS